MLMSGECDNHSHHLPTMSKWLFKTRLHWLYFWWPLKACSETASSFISMYVIGALFAFPLFCGLRPSAKLEDVFTAALGWLKRASAWGQRKQCSCLRLFCAVTAPWQQRVIPRRRWRKGRKQLPGNEATCGCEEASWPLRSYIKYDCMKYPCTKW